MPRTYIPKKSFFESTRIHKIAKDVIRDCKEDRVRALETFTYFKDLITNNPEDDKAKAELIHALGLSQDATNNVVKILDMMIKMTQSEHKIDAAKVEPPAESMSFEDLRGMKKNG
jgi:hypothetical protein